MSTVKANTIEPASGGTVTITGAALTTPALGTPASGTLTNCTGLPASGVVNTPAGSISATTVQGALNELDSEKASLSGASFTGMTAFGAGLKLTGAATLAATAAREWSYEDPVTRYYFGDGTGYNFALAKRVSSTTTDLLTLTDTGDITLTGAGSFAGVVSTGGSLPSSGYGASFVSGLSTGRLTSGGTAGRVTSIATYFDDVAVEVSAGSSSGFKTGIVLGAQNYNGTAGEGVSFYIRGNHCGKWDSNSNLLVNADTSSGFGNCHRITRAGGQGVNILALDGGVEVSGLFQAVSAAGANTSDSALRLGKNSITNRSISAGGTINASGADWAEYRKNNGLKIAKGQIVGYKSDGTLTLTWSEATMARVKTTNPTMVGGDTWGTEAEIGKRPDKPQFKAPDYTGRAKPEDLAAEPQAPAPFEQSAPVHPGEDASLVDAAIYALALKDYNAALRAHSDAVTAHAQALTAWQAAAAQYAQELAEWEEQQSQHDAAMRAAQQHFDDVTMPQYLADKAAFEARLEAARQQVDRIAYCGIVPCNVTGATPGHYIVAAEGPNDTIIGQSVRRPTEDQWSWVVGRCLRVLPDGRAEIDVMLS